jgi:hypothetical protein
MEPVLKILSLSDFIVPFVLVPLILFLYSIAKSKKNLTQPWDSFFLAGFFIRLFSIVFFALIYQYYYKSGDTFIYYNEAVNMRQTLMSGNLQSFIEMIFFDYGNFSNQTLGLIDQDYLYYRSNNHLLISLAGMCNLFCFDSYIGIAIAFTTFGYIGSFFLYREFCQRYPAYYKQLALVLIFFPTTFFWSSGLMKEPICIGAISFIIWGMLQLGKNHVNKWRILLIILVNASLLITLKSYIFYSFVGGLGFALLITGFYKIPLVAHNTLVRWFVPLLFLGLISVGVYFLSSSLSSSSAQLIIGEIANTQSAQIQASLVAGGSGYSLAELSPTPIGLFSFSMSAVVTSLFRPWIWEINKPILLLNGLESFGTLIFTLWIVFKIGISKFFSGFTKNYLPTTFLFYALNMSIVIGIISFNFGTLVRYKAPMLGFYFLTFLLIFIQSKITAEPGSRNKSQH